MNQKGQQAGMRNMPVGTDKSGSGSALSQNDIQEDKNRVASDIEDLIKSNKSNNIPVISPPKHKENPSVIRKGNLRDTQAGGKPDGNNARSGDGYGKNSPPLKNSETSTEDNDDLGLLSSGGRKSPLEPKGNKPIRDKTNFAQLRNEGKAYAPSKLHGHSRPKPDGSKPTQGDRNSTKPPLKRPEIDRNSAKPPPKRPEIDRNSTKPPPKRPEIDRNSTKHSPKRMDTDRNSAKPPPKRPETNRTQRVPPRNGNFLPIPRPIAKTVKPIDGVDTTRVPPPPRHPLTRPGANIPNHLPAKTTKHRPISKDIKPNGVVKIKVPSFPGKPMARPNGINPNPEDRNIAKRLKTSAFNDQRSAIKDEKNDHFERNTFTVSIGLWTAQNCTRLNDETAKCLAVSVEKGLQSVQDLSLEKDFEELRLSTWNDLRAAVSLSLVVCLSGIVGTGLSLKPCLLRGRQRVAVALGICGLVISAAVYLTAVSRIAILNQAIADDSQHLKVGVSVQTPFAVAIGGVGACIALISAVILGCVKWTEERKKWMKFENEVVFTKPEGDDVTPSVAENVHISYQDNSAEVTSA